MYFLAYGFIEGVEGEGLWIRRDRRPRRSANFAAKYILRQTGLPPQSLRTAPPKGGACEKPSPSGEGGIRRMTEGATNDYSYSNLITEYNLRQTYAFLTAIATFLSAIATSFLRSASISPPITISSARSSSHI